MAIVVMFLVVLCCTARVTAASHKHNVSIKQQKTYESEQYKKEGCSSQASRLRNEILEKSKCGEPKEVFHELKVKPASQKVIPSAIWVKRCVGLCDDEVSKCIPTKIRRELIPVRLYDSKTDKEFCATTEVEVHESCRCCPTTSSDCAAPRVFNPPEPEFEVESI